MRIQKFLAKKIDLSRRSIEHLLKQGKIKLNRATAHLGQSVVNDDVLELEGKRWVVKIEKESDHQILMINKPTGVICTKSDIKKRKTIYEILPDQLDSKWFPVGRLDINTSGLLFFCNNGDLANQLMHPRYQLIRTYHVRVFGEINEETIEKLTNGILIDGKKQNFKRCTAIKQKTKSMNNWYEVEVTTGQYRLVRRMWQACGLEVSKLVRVGYGPIFLDRELREGEYRLLHRRELKALEDHIDEVKPK